MLTSLQPFYSHLFPVPARNQGDDNPKIGVCLISSDHNFFFLGGVAIEVSYKWRGHRANEMQKRAVRSF